VPAPSHADAVKAQPRDKRGRVKARSTDPTGGSNGKHGGNPEYLTARIARDAPAILERMKAGEFPSVRAAARAAGILKPLDPVRVALRALAKLTAEERRAFVEAFDAAYPGELGKEVMAHHNLSGPAEEGVARNTLSADEAAAALEKPTRPRRNRTNREETCRNENCISK
jgi:hypothetical protein